MWKVCRKWNDAIRWPLRFRFGFGSDSVYMWNSPYSKEEGKDQESIQPSTTSDWRNHMRKWQKHKKTSHTREPRGQPFPSRPSQGCEKQTRQYNNTVRTGLKSTWIYMTVLKSPWRLNLLWKLLEKTLKGLGKSMNVTIYRRIQQCFLEHKSI